MAHKSLAWGTARNCKWNKCISKIDKSVFVIRRNGNDDAEILYQKYLDVLFKLDIGNPLKNNKPTKPYNLLMGKNWMSAIRRSREGLKGFSINALGFAGYLLATNEADVEWLDQVGPQQLLENVVDPYR